MSTARERLRSPRIPRLRPIVALAFVLGANVAAGCVVTANPRAAARERFHPTGSAGVFRERIDAYSFQRGNIHTHSTESDGDSPPEAVYAWYRDQGYNFLALTDHNKRTNPERYRGLERPGFVLIPGEEITLRAGRAQVHVNALCHRRRIGGNRRSASVGDLLSWAVNRTAQEGGVALVNHPNFHWSFGADELGEATGAKLLEIWSGHPNVNSDGDGSRLSHEEIWDSALSQGWDFAGVAVDDMHKLGAGNNMRQAGPGRGWIEVFAMNASEPEICNALRNGWLVASNGVKINRLTVSGRTLSVAAFAPGGTIEFIGNGGLTLQKQRVHPDGRPNVYHLRGGEEYVRARISAPNGMRAWTQAYRVR